MKVISFAQRRSPLSLPYLVELQKRSFDEFLQKDVPPEKRKRHGLQAAFLDIFPITNIEGNLTLEFIDYNIGEMIYDEEDAIEKDANFSISLKARFRLIATKEGRKDPVIKEQELYICDLPIMTGTGTFIINGAERVIVNQLHRSPGVIFEEDEERKVSLLGKRLFCARIIPYRGAWVEFEFDSNNVLFVRIDKKRKLPATVLLKALGLDTYKSVLEKFYKTLKVNLQQEKKKISGKLIAEDVVNSKTGEVLAEPGQRIDNALLEKLLKAKIEKLNIFDNAPDDVTLSLTLAKDSIKSKAGAVLEIFRRLRAQEYITEDSAQSFFDTLLFKTVKRYDLTKVGRYKVNKRLAETFKNLGMTVPSLYRRTLCLEDIIATMKYLLDLNNNVLGEIDDIDHLGNRRVRSVGEMLENQLRIGLSHLARLVRERMNIQGSDAVTPRDIVNTAPVVGIVRKFFGTSQLSQFMDQTNPLAEMTHKRRLSAIGPGGLSRKRAGFEVRDVHYSHYGRICPIETPEGPNIGLIASLSLYARVNEYGLIETPYRKVNKGLVTNDIDYLTADHDDEYVIAQGNAPLDDKNRFLDDLVAACKKGDYPLVFPKEIDYMDVSPKQLVGVSAGLIPFLEHDDANRALMGSNMQRQAVPVMFTEEPLVSTGIEGPVAKDSGVVIVAKRNGRVASVTSDRIVIWAEEESKEYTDRVDVYRLKKFRRSNQDTCINQKTLVKVGDLVKKGQVIADGPATSQGRLALGRNLLVAFMSWGGYNFEDAIVASERLVKEDVFTSIHIQEFSTEARDLKFGSEEITRDIPNVSEDALQNLDESGIVMVGTYVQPDDILIGKVTPKGETQMTPEERLLKVIFGRKAEEVQDASLRVPPGITGKVLHVQVFTRKGKLGKASENSMIKKTDEYFAGLIEDKKKNKKDELNILEKRLREKEIKKQEYTEYKEQIESISKVEIEELKKAKKKAQENIKKGSELPVAVNKLVKVFIISKRPIAVGDKIAGRHGNKGVVSRILPEEDMPHLPDGTPIELILNPLSVPSRMNVGQILETQLGWAAKMLDFRAITPVFEGAKESEIKNLLKQAGLPEDSRITLYDGRTGEPFKEKVTVGYMYILKLAHLVEDKIHARSIGPYSLITRQPLGGKAQFGGQRFGEMEVWAIEGYGAAYTLQEFLTSKSDDVTGRTKLYESIIKGDMPQEPGIPESFKVLVKELQALCLNVELLRDKK